MVVAVTDRRGATVAALTVPYIATTFSGSREEDVLAAALRTAERIRALRLYCRASSIGRRRAGTLG